LPDVAAPSGRARWRSSCENAPNLGSSLFGPVRSSAIRLLVSPSDYATSLFGPVRSSAIRLLVSPSDYATRGSALLFGISRSALPAWDQENGAAQSDSRPHRALHDRHKSQGELTPSVVPRGTSIRRRRNSGVAGRSTGMVRRRQARPLASNGIPCHQSTCDA
jgi:hypothetical protein